MPLTVGKLVDAEKIGSELEVQKRAVADKQRGIAILRKQVEDWETKCKKLEGGGKNGQGLEDGPIASTGH